MKLDIQIVPTYCIKTINIFDNSTYDLIAPDDTMPELNTPELEITIPNGFDPAIIVFVPNTYNILDSETLGITEEGEDPLPLPDGIYIFKYSVIPRHINVVEKSIFRVDALMEKYDVAFMTLDMMQCDQALKRQEKLDLNEIYYLIQGAISSANNCAYDQALALYAKANSLLTRFQSRSKCCNNGSFIANFTY